MVLMKSALAMYVAYRDWGIVMAWRERGGDGKRRRQCKLKSRMMLMMKMLMVMMMVIDDDG